MTLDEVVYNAVLAAVLQHRHAPRHWQDRKNLRIVQQLIGCLHILTVRGRNIPRRWGSYRSEFCVDCHKYRVWDHNGKLADPTWRDDYEQAILPDDDD